MTNDTIERLFKDSLIFEQKGHQTLKMITFLRPKVLSDLSGMTFSRGVCRSLTRIFFWPRYESKTKTYRKIYWFHVTLTVSKPFEFVISVLTCFHFDRIGVRDLMWRVPVRNLKPLIFGGKRTHHDHLDCVLRTGANPRSYPTLCRENLEGPKIDTVFLQSLYF